MKNVLVTQAERAHLEALAATRRAIREGDLVKAERWMKLAERHNRASVESYRQHDLRVAERVVQRENVRRHNQWLAAQKEAPDGARTTSSATDA